jgi:hypothetical protein
MIIAQQVKSYLDSEGSDFCDDCIAQLVGLKRRQQAQRVTSVLALTPGYNRYDGKCDSCGEFKLVIGPRAGGDK